MSASQPPSAASRISAFCLFAAMAFSVGALGRLLHDAAYARWAALAKPFFAPGDAWFVVSWGALFVVMTWSAMLVWSAADGKLRAVRRQILVYALQLASLAAWTLALFGTGQLWTAAAIMGAQIILVGWMIRAFWLWSPGAALLQLPYLAWTVCAAIITLWIAAANRI